MSLYAVAALAGAAVAVIGTALRLPSTAVTIAGAVLCFGLRFIAIRHCWHLPVAGEPEHRPQKCVRSRLARMMARETRLGCGHGDALVNTNLFIAAVSLLSVSLLRFLE